MAFRIFLICFFIKIEIKFAFFFCFVWWLFIYWRHVLENRPSSQKTTYAESLNPIKKCYVRFFLFFFLLQKCSFDINSNTKHPKRKWFNSIRIQITLTKSVEMACVAYFPSLLCMFFYVFFMRSIFHSKQFPRKKLINIDQMV